MIKKMSFIVSLSCVMFSFQSNAVRWNEDTDTLSMSVVEARKYAVQKPPKFTTEGHEFELTGEREFSLQSMVNSSEEQTLHLPKVGSGHRVWIVHPPVIEPDGKMHGGEPGIIEFFVKRLS